MRAFFCLPVPAAARHTLACTSDALRDSVQMRASWVAEENYHFTVRFLGEIDPMLTVDLKEMATRVASSIPPFSLRIDRVGGFPALDRARVVWAGGETPDAFSDLVQRISEALERLGFERERRRPTAHVTLARVKGRPDPQLATLAARLNPLDIVDVAADRLVLMESQLGPRGATYSPLFETSLRRDGG